MLFSRTKSPISLRGFTLVELIVSLSIVAFITGVVVYNQSDFSDQISLSNTAHEIDLQIREAQIYGTSVREYAPSTNEFNVAYGVDFNFNNGGASTNSYIFFADRSPQNGYYDTPTSTCSPGTSPTPECIAKNNLSRSNVISNVCVIPSSGAEQCSSSIGRIDITFLRPNPSAIIKLFNSSGSIVNSSYPGFKGVRIELKSPKNKKQSIYIYTTGETAVQ